MANVFGILTAIALALSAFVAFKNQAAYEKDLSDTESRKEELTKSEARLAADKEVLAALPPEIEGVDAEVDKLTADEAAQKKVNDGLSKQVEEKTAKIAADKEKLDGIREKTAKIGNINELASKITQSSAEIEELKQSITGNEAKLANLTAQNASTESQITDTKGKFDDFAGGRSLASLNTRIRSIYPNWGFVTLASGNNAGVVTSSTLNVVRNDQVIAKLLVTAVEATTASASIVPDSMAADATLMVGDRVVPGLKETKPAASAPVVPAAAN
jgi:cell division protein FtsB